MLVHSLFTGNSRRNMVKVLVEESICDRSLVPRSAQVHPTLSWLSWSECVGACVLADFKDLWPFHVSISSTSNKEDSQYFYTTCSSWSRHPCERGMIFSLVLDPVSCVAHAVQIASAQKRVCHGLKIWATQVMWDLCCTGEQTWLA